MAVRPAWARGLHTTDLVTAATDGFVAAYGVTPVLPTGYDAGYLRGKIEGSIDIRRVNGIDVDELTTSWIPLGD
jgi:hypothetical protein